MQKLRPKTKTCGGTARNQNLPDVRQTVCAVAVESDRLPEVPRVVQKERRTAVTPNDKLSDGAERSSL